MTLDEAIVHAREKSEQLKDHASKWKHSSEECESQFVREKASEKCEECLECAKEHEQLVDWLEELKERREADRWVNAKERKPEKDGVYLVVVEFQHILLVTYYDIENEHWGTANDVIAWRPLPEAYKESEAEDEQD